MTYCENNAIAKAFQWYEGGVNHVDGAGFPEIRSGDWIVERFDGSREVWTPEAFRKKFVRIHTQARVRDGSVKFKCEGFDSSSRSCDWMLRDFHGDWGFRAAPGGLNIVMPGSERQDLRYQTQDLWLKAVWLTMMRAEQFLVEAIDETYHMVVNSQRQRRNAEAEA